MAEPTTPQPLAEVDPTHPEIVLGLDEPLATFNTAGVLSAVDCHTALRLARLTGCTDPLALLGAAFAVRAPRFGHVQAVLADLPATVTDEDGRTVPIDPDRWPDLDQWLAALAASPMVASGPAEEGTIAPLHLDDGRLYLDRYWRHETRTATAIAERAAHADRDGVTLAPAGESALKVLFGDDNAEQLQAARAALTTSFAVVAGGPGTGKTATIARIVALASKHATIDGRPVRIGIAAPTGKAAARLGEAMREAVTEIGAAGSMLVDVDVADRVVPQTVHRMLGGSRSSTRFRHDAANPLPLDLVVVDEVSMVPLALLGRLLDAVRPDATLVLVGDPDQLASVEAGSVLGDMLAVGEGTVLAGQVTTLTRNYRSTEAIIAFAGAVREGQADDALAMVARNPADPRGQAVSLVTPEVLGVWPQGTGRLTGVRELLVSQALEASAAAQAGDGESALKATMGAQVLCAHRRGLDGVTVWNAAVEGWASTLPSYRRPVWYPGRPIIASRNDYDLGIFNGDIGVTITDGDRLAVVVDGRDAPPVDHRRLGEVQTVHAMTIHKSQGSQFDDVIVVLPTDPSPILTRELLYTAVTRARRSVTIVGTEEALRRGITRQVQRASALPARLRDLLPPPD